MVTQMSLEDYCTSFLGFLPIYSPSGREWRENPFSGRPMVG